MKDRRKWILLVGLMVGILVLFLVFPSKKDPVKEQIERIKKNPPPVASIEEDILQTLEVEENPEGSIRYSDEDLTLEEMALLLRKNYGKNIHNRWVQIRLIEDLIRTLKSRYPDRWVEELYILLKVAFPDRADEIFSLFEKYQEYQSWLEEVREDLKDLSPKERKEALWEKRREIFGDMAEEIWKREYQQDRLVNALEKIDASSSSILEKLSQFKSSIEEIYQEEAPYILSNRAFSLSQRFLLLPSVQKELSSRSEEERYDLLKRIRSSLGLPSDAVKRLEELDKERDKRWEIGRRYMEEREKLIQKGASEEEIHQLRLKYFSPEMAEILREEEASGFFRFQQKRLYGIN